MIFIPSWHPSNFGVVNGVLDELEGIRAINDIPNHQAAHPGCPWIPQQRSSRGESDGQSPFTGLTIKEFGHRLTGALTI